MIAAEGLFTRAQKEVQSALIIRNHEVAGCEAFGLSDKNRAFFVNVVWRNR